MYCYDSKKLLLFDTRSNLQMPSKIEIWLEKHFKDIILSR